MKLFLWLICLPILALASLSTWSLRHYLVNDLDAFMPLYAGIGIFFLIDRFLLRLVGYNLNWLHTFHHEMSHIIAVLLAGGKVREFRVTDQEGGHVLHQTSPRFKGMVALFPYSVPGLPLVSIALMPILSADVLEIYKYILGAFMGLYISSQIGDLRVKQTDWDYLGIPTSFLFIITSNIFFLGIIITSYMEDNFMGSLEYIHLLENSFYFIKQKIY